MKCQYCANADLVELLITRAGQAFYLCNCCSRTFCEETDMKLCMICTLSVRDNDPEKREQDGRYWHQSCKDRVTVAEAEARSDPAA